MTTIYAADLVNGELKIHSKRTIEKNIAQRRVRQGDNVYTSKSSANTLANSISDGQGTMKHATHVLGGYHHYHDINHFYNGHIFYGDPSG
jgi:hypothetical protein